MKESGRKTKALGKIFLRNSKKGYRHIVSWQGWYEILLSSCSWKFERDSSLAMVSLVWETVRKKGVTSFRHYEIIYGLDHSHLSTFWLSSTFTHSPMKWLGNRSGVDQFLWNIGHLKYSDQVYWINKKQGEPDSSLLIFSFLQSCKKLRDFKKLPMPRKDKEVPERNKNWPLNIVNSSVPLGRETNAEGQAKWDLEEHLKTEVFCQRCFNSYLLYSNKNALKFNEMH